MLTSAFDFHLPPQLIAQEPLPDRDAARLLVLDRAAHSWRDGSVRELPELLRPGDLLVLNDTRVIPARLRAVRDLSGGKIEILLLPPEPAAQPQEAQPVSGDTIPIATQSGHVPGNRRRVLLRAGGKLKVGETFTLAGGCRVTLRERLREAGDLLEFHCSPEEFEKYVAEQGEIPLPPYIHRPAGPSRALDRQRYQTVFAHTPGAVAAPTAGLHFSQKLLEQLQARGVERRYLTLHVGPGTFKPVKAEEVAGHFVDPEPFLIPAETAQAVRAAKREGRRVVAVGTTSLRALEGSAEKLLAGGECLGSTGLYIYPPFQFKIADALLTNFHIPRSSLLMLACAFASPGTTEGIEFVQSAYKHAVESGYRFYSYGDACLFV